MPKKTKQEILKPLSVDDYQSVFSKLVHFSFKTINSNATEGGIRLSQSDDGLATSYICTRKLINSNHDIPTDYTKNSGTPAPATVLKHYRAANQGSDELIIENSEQIIEIYKNETKSRLEVNTDCVSPRMNQVLLPIGENMSTYLSTTVLVSPGLMSHVNKVVKNHNSNHFTTIKELKSNKRNLKDNSQSILSNKQLIKTRKINTGFIGKGGSNPQNVGSLVRELCSPLFFQAPTENNDMKKLWSLYYKGFAFLIPFELIDKYRQWRFQQLIQTETMPSTMKYKEKESELIQNIAMNLIHRFESAKKFMEEHVEILPNNQITHPNLDGIQKGILDQELRDDRWKTDIANLISKKIANFSFSDGKQLGLNDQGIRSNSAIIRKLL